MTDGCVVLEPRRRGASREHRLWRFIYPEPNSGCWLWLGSISRGGYGQVWSGKALIPSHRFAYEIYKGKIPEGLQIDHLCRNPFCCNPDHLEATTQKINILRGISLPAQNARKRTCAYGHSLADAIRRSDGHRICRECNRRRCRRT